MKVTKLSQATHLLSSIVVDDRVKGGHRQAAQDVLTFLHENAVRLEGDLDVEADEDYYCMTCGQEYVKYCGCTLPSQCDDLKELGEEFRGLKLSRHQKIHVRNLLRIVGRQVQ